MADRAQDNFKFLPIDVLPGTSPLADNTALSTPHYTDSEKIRYYRGKPQKLGGWEQFSFDGNVTVEGCPRNIYSQKIGDSLYTLIGTNTRLYALLGTQLTNITPIQTATIAIANSLDSNFTTLANDPFDTVISSTTVTVNSTAHKLIAGDVIEISGATATNGIPAVELNSTHIIRTTTVNSYTIFVTTAATSTGSGGGAAVDEQTAIITVNRAAHGLSNGDRIKITLAVGFAGIPAGEINVEHIIRAVTTNTFDIVVITEATSSVSGGGGAATLMQDPIAEGKCDASFGQGYGVGRYGVGRYGVSKTGTSGLILPQIWSFDRFGNNVILCPGNDGGIFEWDGDLVAAPAIITTAPSANYVFVSDNIVVALGAATVENRVQWSDQGDSNDWTAVATNLAGEDDIEGANRFLSHVNIRGVNLLWTDKQLYTMRIIGAPFVWEFRRVENASGIIAQNARISHNGVAYWQGEQDFFFYTGGTVQSIPSNAPDRVNYIRQFTFDDINTIQCAKSFAWFNKKFSEIWFHYPEISSNEPNRIVRFSIQELHWSIDRDFDRVAAEYPIAQDQNPKLIDSTGILYKHEKGVNDAANAMNFSLTTKSFQNASNQVEIGTLIPDSIQTNDITLTLTMRPYPQSSRSIDIVRTITPTDEKKDLTGIGRDWDYKIEQNILGGNWRMGTWFQGIQIGSPR